VGKRWDEALHLDQRSREMVRKALRLPEAERDRLTLSVRTQAERHARRLEIDVHDDPRDPGRRILFLRDWKMYTIQKSTDEGRAVENLVHASGNPEEAEAELKLWL